MKTNYPVNNYDPDDDKFKTLDEFKFYMSCGCELCFEYHGVQYGTERLNERGTFGLWECNDSDDTLAMGISLEELLDFEIDGVKIRDFITTDDVIITDRPGPSY